MLLNRRRMLQLGAAMGAGWLLGGCRHPLQLGLDITGYWPGMQEGHWLRGNTPIPAPSGERKVGVAILGSGVAGLFAAWQLARQGRQDILLVEGPERYGNCAAGSMGGEPYPRGAHYLPLPSLESTHVRELLFEMGVIEADPFGERPRYDERVLVHAPEERLWVDGRWQEGTLPRIGMGADELAQQQRFLDFVAGLRERKGRDGRRLFVIPLALSSSDPEWRALDKLTFAAWLKQQGYTAPGLLWYLDYVCRDDYGAGSAEVSAWAGLHYFASRGGHAANAENGAVLTWPDGLNPLARHMLSRLQPQQRLPGMAVRVTDRGRHVEVDVFDVRQGRSVRLLADQVICAMPLHVASRVVTGIRDLGYDPERHALPHAAWQVSNFLIDAFPEEPHEHPLAWDNVVYGSNSLGYINSTHQLIRQGKPAQSVFTAYHAYSGVDPRALRHQLERASADDLYEIAAQDLHAVYGWRWRHYVKQVEITVRGHAMSTPAPGFLDNPGLKALREADGRIRFAHADLSGLSVFEEAGWWGSRTIA
ncbi:FAD-dependent oxidoreductase [Chitinilyticum litopenaei]|uniref:FAD-dependent oxidoreductase n=1 Tax=Chitinilyticum litopenaei TaxID=1121276 RepID=UPI000402786F|nr:FAD-dependent oxidoreductase [Chitinilyticum litopenaei]